MCHLDPKNFLYLDPGSGSGIYPTFSFGPDPDSMNRDP
jgi:hypothetical protein